MNREILSIQGGKYANYCGAHFWNIQELSFSYDEPKSSSSLSASASAEEGKPAHDILYREGLSGGRITFTPRLLLLDSRDSLGTLSRSGGLPQPEASTSNNTCDWHQVETIKQPIPEKNKYLKYIDGDEDVQPEEEADIKVEPEEVNTWTDYLYARFHPRTVNLVNATYIDENSAPLQTFHSGLAAWNTDHLSESFSDNMRKYIEECNNLQGFQISFDATDGYGGLMTSCMEHIVDEYPNKSIIAFPLIASHFPDNVCSNQRERDLSNLRDSIRLINNIFSFENCFQFSTLFSPLCCGERGWRQPGLARRFPSVNYQSEMYYHSSAIIASALDTISLKYRRSDASFTMSDLCADMTGYSRKMAATSLGLPFEMKENEYLIQRLDQEGEIYTCITPNCTISTDKIFQHISVRGIPNKLLKKPLKSADGQIKMPAYRCESRREMFELYFQSRNFLSATNVTVCDTPLKIGTPFPEIFSEHLNKNGFIKEFENAERAEVVPVISGLHNGNFIFNTLENLCREAKRVKIKKLHGFKETGLEDDDVAECIEKIAEIQNNYEDNFEL